MTRDMTKQEALGRLEFVLSHTSEDTKNTSYYRALGVAVEALREATTKEEGAIDRFIKSISKPTGFNFYNAYINKDYKFSWKNYDLSDKTRINYWNIVKVNKD